MFLLSSYCKLSKVAMTCLKTSHTRCCRVCGVDDVDLGMSRSCWPCLLISVWPETCALIQLQFRFYSLAKIWLILPYSSDDFISHPNVAKDLSMVRMQSHTNKKFSILHYWHTHSQSWVHHKYHHFKHEFPFNKRQPIIVKADEMWRSAGSCLIYNAFLSLYFP